MKSLRVFVASPGDVAEEREIVDLVVNDLRTTIAPALSVTLEVVKWETHVRPAVGVDAQDVVNAQIGEFDIFVGVMWRRFGTPSQRAESGTEEEFLNSYDLFKEFGRPAIMMYFKTKEFFPSSSHEVEQVGKVLDFKDKVVELGVLYGEYKENLDFERLLRRHLTNHLLDTNELPKRRTPNSPKVKVYLSYKREDLERVEPIYEALERNGMVPWMDIKDISPGQKWVDEIEAAIAECDVFLSFVSDHTSGKSVNSQTGFSVGTELRIALGQFDTADSRSIGNGRKRLLIPVRLDSVTPPSDLSQHQWVDVFDNGGVDKLVDALKEFRAKL